MLSRGSDSTKSIDMKKLVLMLLITLCPMLVKADSWTPVGQGTWKDGTFVPFCGKSWNVPIECSVENPKLFRIQPYCLRGNHLSGLPTDNVYVYIHVENSEKVYMEDYAYSYNGHHIWLSQKCEENGWDINYYGKIIGNCVEFPETTFMYFDTVLNFINSPEHSHYNTTSAAKHKIVFPEGVLDYVPQTETFVSIGEGTWLDIFMTITDGEKVVPAETWTVEFEKSADRPGRYRARPWCNADAMHNGIRIDGEVIICADDPDKVYLENFVLNGDMEYSQIVVENGWANGNSYGKLVDGVITIPRSYFKRRAISSDNWDEFWNINDNLVIKLPEDYFVTPSSSGVYFGITAFNYEPRIKPIELLTKNNKEAFKQFVNEREKADATYLYYSADVAIKALTERKYPDDLNSVAMITFTDGNDDGSLENAPDKSWNDEDYQNYLAGRLSDARVQGHPINAFSIGLKGKDIGDYNYEMFKSNLQVLASKSEQATEVNDMSEVETTINDILDNLEKSWINKKVSCSITMRATGDRIRFTLDKTREEMNNNPENSDLWIEGVFSRDDNSLNDVVYNGMTSTSGSKVLAERTEINGRTKYKFTFENLRDADGNTIETSTIEFWHKTASNPVWQPHTEFKQGADAVTETERTSSAVMFVMDCSDSLDNDFPELQRVVNSLIDRLAEGDNSGVEDIPFYPVCDDETDAPVEYYNLQGLKIDNPRSGLYIRRLGNKVEKILII